MPVVSCHTTPNGITGGLKYISFHMYVQHQWQSLPCALKCGTSVFETNNNNRRRQMRCKYPEALISLETFASDILLLLSRITTVFLFFLLLLCDPHIMYRRRRLNHHSVHTLLFRFSTSAAPLHPSFLPASPATARLPQQMSAGSSTMAMRDGRRTIKPVSGRTTKSIHQVSYGNN